MTQGASGMFMVFLTPVALLSYLVAVLVGIVVFGMRALIRGDLRTKPEVDALIERAENAEEALRTRDETLNLALAVLPEVTDVLRKFHAGAGLPTAAPPAEVE